MKAPMQNIQHLIPEFERWKERYPEGFEGSLTIPCLRRIQEERGYIADSDIDELVAYLGVPRTQVDEVLGFYTMFTREPIGKHHLQVPAGKRDGSVRGGDQALLPAFPAGVRRHSGRAGYRLREPVHGRGQGSPCPRVRAKA